jgi:hypothetical protein
MYIKDDIKNHLNVKRKSTNRDSRSPGFQGSGEKQKLGSWEARKMFVNNLLPPGLFLK